MRSTPFPVGYYQLHPDVSMNFQMNRWLGWVGEAGMLDEMRSVAPRIAGYADWKREFLALAENASVVNLLARSVAKGNPIAEWGIEEGMHVTGTSSPYEYFQQIRQFHTADTSQRVTQHVLLLAGSEDHLVPMAHLYRQIKLLKNARSITARVFTESESAGNHCQVGNYGLALRTIVHWLDGI